LKELVSVVLCVAWTAAAFAQVEVYQKQLEANPRDAVAHFRLGEIFLSQKNYQSASSEFRSAINGDSPPRWILDAAGAQLQMIAESFGTKTEYLPPASKPVSLGLVQPEYTDEARLAGLEGVVSVSGILREDGALEDLQLESKLGLGLDESAIAAIGKWRYMGEPLAERAVVQVSAEFTLPEKKSRWHLAGVEFRPPRGASRPVFVRVPYPFGAGISREAVDQGRFVIAVGRSATATISFDVGTDGRPSNPEIVSQSEETWGPQAIGLVREWEFQPGMKDGVAVTVPCTMTLVWGERNIPAALLASAGRERETATAPAAFSPEVRYQPEPAYSPEALAAKQEGTVEIALVVSLDGTPSDLRVVQPLGFGLDEKALEAVSKWRFAPALVNGRPEKVRAVVKVPFRLPAE
jgi:TonB family protein